MRRRWYILLTPVIAAGVAARAEEPSYSRDVAPVFEKYCVGCHATQVKLGGLELDTFEGATKTGAHGPVIVPGKAEESRLFLMIAGKVKPVMPMDGKTMASGEIDSIRRWIDAGAKFDGSASAAAAPKTAIPDIRPRKAVKPQVFAIAYSPDGKTLALAGYQEVRLLDAATRKTVATLGGHSGSVRALAFSGDGKLLAAAGGLPGQKGEIRIWDAAAHTLVRSITGHSDCIYAVAFPPDARFVASSSYDKLIKIWSVETGEELRTLKDHIDAVYALAYTPDGKRIVSGAADRTVKIWDAASGRRLYTLGEPQDGINSIAIHPSGRYVAAGGLDKSIRVWSLGETSGTLVQNAIAHEDAILKLAWSPDGNLLVSSAADRTIKAFRPDLTEVQTIGAQPDWAYAVEFSPDGKVFAVARFDGTLSIYDTERFQDVIATQLAGR